MNQAYCEEPLKMSRLLSKRTPVQITQDGPQNPPIPIQDPSMEIFGSRRLASTLSKVVAAWIRFAQETILHDKVLVDPLIDALPRVIRNRALRSADIADDVVALKSIAGGEPAVSPDFRQTLNADYVTRGGGGGICLLSALD